MRKQPLIALSAFVALLGGAIAGVATGTFNAVPTSASSDVLAAWIAPGIVQGESVHAGPTTKLALAPSEQRAVNDVIRPRDFPILANALHKPKPKHKPKRHKASSRALLTTVPPTTVPPATVPPTTVTATAPAGGVWYELRMCESSDDYSTNTGNGFYGAYQFALSTWLGLGFTGLPSNAPPAVQDRAAQELQARSGWGQWPACSAKLGL